MAAPQVFKVLTQFKFEVGSAVASAGNLEGALGGVSSAADQLQFKLARVGFGFAAQLGLGAGGIIGTLGQVIGQYGKIESAQNRLAQQLFAQKGYFTGVNDTNDALKLSEKLITKIGKDAQKFGLDESSFAAGANTNIGILGSAGVQPSAAVDFTRNLQKSAPNLGVNAGLLQDQVADILGGALSRNSRAEQRLFAETDVFKKFIQESGGVTNAIKKWNKKSFGMKKRFDILNQAFGQFTSNMTLLERQANEISRLVKRIRDALFGLNGVFKPLGEALAGPLKEALNLILKKIQSDLAPLILKFTQLLSQMPQDLETIIIRLQELSAVAKNFQRAGILALIATLLPLGIVFKSLKFAIGGGLGLLFKGGAAAGLGRLLVGLGSVFKGFLAIGRVFAFLIGSLAKFIPQILFFMFILQTIARAIAIAKVNVAKRFADSIGSFMDSINRLVAAFKILFEPVSNLMTLIAEFLAPAFESVVAPIEFVLRQFEKLEMVFLSFVATLVGITTVIVGIIDSLKKGNFSEATDTTRMAGLFQQGVNGFLGDVFRDSGQLKDVPLPDDVPTSGVTQNINTVNVNQEFKEKFEPDRIAFSVVDQLKKIGQNNTRGKGQTLSNVGAGG